MLCNIKELIWKRISLMLGSFSSCRAKSQSSWGRNGAKSKLRSAQGSSKRMILLGMWRTWSWLPALTSVHQRKIRISRVLLWLSTVPRLIRNFTKNQRSSISHNNHTFLASWPSDRFQSFTCFSKDSSKRGQISGRSFCLLTEMAFCIKINAGLPAILESWSMFQQ